MARALFWNRYHRVYISILRSIAFASILQRVESFFVCFFSSYHSQIGLLRQPRVASLVTCMVEVIIRRSRLHGTP
jgi:hypothetical protein